jgi:hypothetical protein
MTGRTVTIATSDHGNVTIPEPAWCLGYHPADRYRMNIGPSVETTSHGDSLLPQTMGERSVGPQGCGHARIHFILVVLFAAGADAPAVTFHS